MMVVAIMVVMCMPRPAENIICNSRLKLVRLPTDFTRRFDVIINDPVPFTLSMITRLFSTVIIKNGSFSLFVSVLFSLQGIFESFSFLLACFPFFFAVLLLRAYRNHIPGTYGYMHIYRCTRR